MDIFCVRCRAEDCFIRILKRLFYATDTNICDDGSFLKNIGVSRAGYLLTDPSMFIHEESRSFHLLRILLPYLT